MKTQLTALFIACSVFFSLSAAAHPGHEAPPMPKEFEQVKKLVGTWEGTSKMGGDKEMPVTVVYELTSGGTVVTEKLMPGTPHEMISVYHKEGKGLAMTHYCAMGNHPMMTLQKADDKEMNFEMAKVSGIASMKESHMHALKLSMADADTLTQEWTNFEDGKAKENAVFHFKRKK